MPVVVTNRVPVAPGWEEKFEDRFRKRVHLVDRSPGFIRNEVHRPRRLKLDHTAGGFVEDPDAEAYYEIKTWWRNLDDFLAWTRSPAFAEAHKSRAPAEMFAGNNQISVHEVLTSTDLDGVGD
ncbi:MAG: antibiotic biosynthesis monooxygenase [Deltaproteobacteria bacterium]|nr:antibiotic biosynthesis monooxygenase [Deltaproteobacteria bacterium]MBW2361790.1 antibiotic biosynthesis monooxygenase [Deltaproteobacteria bacterium]